MSETLLFQHCRRSLGTIEKLVHFSFSSHLSAFQKAYVLANQAVWILFSSTFEPVLAQVMPNLNYETFNNGYIEAALRSAGSQQSVYTSKTITLRPSIFERFR